MADEKTPDLRSTIEAAFEKEEANAPAPAPAPAPESKPAAEAAPVPAPAAEADTTQKEVPADGDGDGARAKLLKAAPPPPPAVLDETEEEAQFRKPIDPEKPPASWKPLAKAKWSEVPLEARMEVHRRDREVTRVLTETSQARQLQGKFQEVVTPFAAHIQARGARDAFHAIGELLKTDYLLTNAPPAKKAEAMAQIIKDYGIDIPMLDTALSGQQIGDPTTNAVERLLAQRLAPLENFLKGQASVAERQQQAATNKIQAEMESMEADTTKYPFFSDVREDMADIIELSAKRGIYLSLDQAYSKAVAINPTVNQAAEATKQDQAAKAAAKASQARVDKARAASVSVSGAPVVVGKTVSPNDLRGTIEAAFEQLGGR